MNGSQEIAVQHLPEQHPEIDCILGILVAPEIEFVGNLQLDGRYEEPDVVEFYRLRPGHRITIEVIFLELPLDVRDDPPCPGDPHGKPAAEHRVDPPDVVGVQEIESSRQEVFGK
jgi:hypothetical protein